MPKPPPNAKLYDFKGEVPPWPSYCRMCWRRAGLDPYHQNACPDARTCEHYPFKWHYRPKPKEKHG